MKSLSTKPVFTTGIAAEMIDIEPKTLINYEREGLVTAARTNTNRRKFSASDLFIVQIIRYLIKKKGMTFKSVKCTFEFLKKLEKDKIEGLKYLVPDKKLKSFRKKVEL